MKTTNAKTPGVARFRRSVFGQKPTYTCGMCKKLTRETGDGESSCDLCAACYRAAGIENEHFDGYHDETPSDECPKCNTGKPEVSPAPTDKKENTMATTKTTGNAAKAKSEVAKLIKKLTGLKDKSDNEGRAIRRMLRKLGHWGGLGTKGADHSPAKAKAPAKADKIVKAARKQEKKLTAPLTLTPTAKAAREAAAAE